MLRIARLDVRFLQLFEARSVGLHFSRPCLDQPVVDPLGLGAQKNKVMDVRRVESAYQQNAVVISFRRLMKLKGGIIQPPFSDSASIEIGKASCRARVCQYV